VSPDPRGLLVVVDLTTELMAARNWPIISQVEEHVTRLRHEGKVPEGLKIDITGSAVIGRDHNLAQLQSARATGLLTVILVIVLLVAIYRAPLLALIPLATVFLSVQVAIHVLSLLAQAGWITLFEGIQIYITILAYGAGVDYCLFLTARYREELEHGTEPGEAVSRAVSGVGHALVASAGTVMVGIAMMMFAGFGKFREAGFAIPFSLLLVLAATLTFSPALLRLAGRWAFWPRHPETRATEPAPRKESELEWVWDHMGKALRRKPWHIWLGALGIMLPCVLLGAAFSNQVSYDLIGDLPADVPSVAGTRALQEHFPAGMMGPLTVVIVDPSADFASPAGRKLVKDLTDRLVRQKKELGLADVRSLTAPLGSTAQAAGAFTNSDIPREAREEAVQTAALKHYATDMGGRKKVGTRVELVLEQSPFSHQSIDNLERVKHAVTKDLPERLASAELHFVGATASLRDIAVVVQRDRTRIELLVLASVLLILVVLLRGVVVPVYLLLSVLFSYYATLGALLVVFWVLDPAGFTGIDWKVAIFLFTILVAVGEDYNIFLMTRIHEEQEGHGIVGGVTHALTRTGPIISSCGIIMAGTFATLLAGSLLEMKQLGFALAFGVLLDTFVVRPILVPAFLLLGCGRLGVLGNRGARSDCDTLARPEAGAH
jgi:RND superfamily putative drug exporter